MSLQDESFPHDELFAHLIAKCSDSDNNNNNSLQRQFSVELGLPESKNYTRDDASPFVNSDCSEETCASDPVGLEHDEPDNHDTTSNGECTNQATGQGQRKRNGNGNGNGNSSGSSKAVSYQDIHSAYTKRRYKHVTSKVRKYMYTDNKEQQARGVASSSGSGTFQRHRSMPESLTPRGAVGEDERKMSLDTSLADTNHVQDEHDESYERLMNEHEYLRSRNNHLELTIHQKISDIIVLRRNFDTVRNELMDCQEKLKRQTNLMKDSLRPPLLLSYSQPVEKVPQPERVTQATQTDLEAVQRKTHITHLSDLSDLPVIPSNATPHPNANLNDLTYDSITGSIEIALLSVRPTAQQMQCINGHLKPTSLSFNNVSNDMDSNGNALVLADTETGVAPSSSNRGATNNSGSSHPSSNDSAIEIEGHETRSPHQQRYRSQTTIMRDWSSRENIIYFDKRTNGVIELVPMNSSLSRINNSNDPTAANTDPHSHQVFQLVPPYQVNSREFMGRRKKSFASRMLRILGPCARCDDPNQSADGNNTTYTVGLPLLADDSSRL